MTVFGSGNARNMVRLWTNASFNIRFIWWQMTVRVHEDRFSSILLGLLQRGRWKLSDYLFSAISRAIVSTVFTTHNFVAFIQLIQSKWNQRWHTWLFRIPYVKVHPMIYGICTYPDIDNTDLCHLVFVRISYHRNLENRFLQKSIVDYPFFAKRNSSKPRNRLFAQNLPCHVFKCFGSGHMYNVYVFPENII